MNRKKELSFEDFQRLAADSNLSSSQKIGFPDSYRKGFSRIILQDICTKLPLNTTTGKVVVDIGCGCDELAFLLIELCKENSHKLILIDSEEMLRQLPDGDGIVKVPGKFPANKDFVSGQGSIADYILCYSVLFYEFANGNMYSFLHAALDMLRSGGRLLLGDIPNADARDRFLQSAEGEAFLRGNTEIPGCTSHDNRAEKMDDSVVLGILARLRRFGCETYLLPQGPLLPMANRREDILVLKR